MKKAYSSCRNPFSALLLIAVLLLAMTGALLATADEAAADPPALAPFRVTNVSPVVGETDAPLSPLIKVDFNIAFKPSTITADSFYLEKPGGAKAKGHFEFALGNTRAMLKTDEVLQPGTTYKVVLTKAIKSSGILISHPLSPYSWTFKTTTAPKVVKTIPAAEANNVPLDQTVRVTFDRDIDPATVKQTTFYLKEWGESGTVSAQVFCEANKRDILLAPAAKLKKDTTYQVTLTTGIKGTNNLPLEKQATWLFTTIADPLPPPSQEAFEVVSRLPAPDAVDVHPGSAVNVTFNARIDPNTFNDSTFYLYELHVGPVSAGRFFSFDGLTVTLRPDKNLDWGKTYRMTVTTGVKAFSGPALKKAVSWTFTTAAAPPLPPPPPTIAFSDVNPGDPYYDAIMALATKKIVSGYGDGKFGPGDPVKRAQFAKMIVGTLGLPVTENDWPHSAVPFVDLGPDDPNDLYPHEYVSVCFRNGITKGKTDRQFAPYDDITRYRVISMVVRAVEESRPGYLVTPPASFGLWRGDSTHGLNAAKAEYCGLLTGLGHSGGLQSLDPYGWMTRGEVAQVLHNLLNLSPKVL